MREDTKPVYEAEENREGGAITIRVPTDCAKDIWSSFIVHAVCDELFIPGEDPKQVKGVIISPKRGNIIIQVWTPTRVDPNVLSPIIDFSDNPDRNLLETVGYMAIIKLGNYEKSVFMSKSEIIDHADKYSPSFNKKLYKNFFKFLYLSFLS